MSPVKFFMLFCAGWIGLSFLLSLFIGKILRWLETDADA